MSDAPRGTRSTVPEPELAGLTAVVVGVALLALAQGELEALVVAVAAMLVVLGTTEVLGRHDADPHRARSTSAHGPAGRPADRP